MYRYEPRKANKVVLNKSLAAEIYSQKLSVVAPSTFDSCFKKCRLQTKGLSAKVALKYGVSPKTIRDIWNKRTWTDATRSLWEPEYQDLKVRVNPLNFRSRS